MRHIECKEIKQKISDYLDGDLSDELCKELERHMNDCEDCRVVINTYKKTIELSKKVDNENSLPGDIRQRLFKCLDLNDFIEDHETSTREK